ncbi:MAG: isoprenylcysteine carboxylmethyltransferase family protein, partial [Methanotrichaceae archaeon]|nr:isoprenylcysteine carboxylmethyltransferase family protein [Methanotrichaceae archaeon]
MFLIFALALFLAAGTIRWIAGWCFLVLFFGFTIVISLWLLSHNPGLLQERMTGLRKLQASDKVLMSLIGICFIAWLVLMPLDAVRFHWSEMPVWIQAVGAIILIGSFYLFYIVYRENPYLSPAIRIQEERGQTVISTGLYHYVRHPYYSASFLLVIGTTLLLGSWYGVLAGAILISLISIRALLEERMLYKELKGYDIYMAQV